MQDGVDGWELVDYTWSLKTGIGRYTYEKTFSSGEVVEHVVLKAQPYHPSHTGWYTGAMA